MEHSQLLEILNSTDNCALRIPQEKKEQIIHNPLLKETFDALNTRLEEFRGTPILSIPFSVFKLYETTGDRRAFEGGKNGYFIRRVRLNAFAISAWLFGKAEDISELEDAIWAICDEYTWSLPAHLNGTGLTTLQSDGYMVDLFASETADALSEICFLLEDKLFPIGVKRARHLVKERVLESYLHGQFGWEHGKSNWAAVCGGSVGMAAIYTAENNDKLCEILEKLQSAFESFLQSFSSDGACLEGIGYWTYGFSYYVSFAELLYRRTGGKIDMLDCELVEKIAAFQQKCFFKQGRTVSFSDGGSHADFVFGLTCFLTHRFASVKLPPFQFRTRFPVDSCGRWSNDLRNFLWADEKIDEDGPVGGCYPLPDAQWYLCSSADGNVGIAAKAGHNEEPHNHNDVGAFEIYKNGQCLIADLGGGRYSRQYFSDERYNFFCCSSRGHSCPIVGGEYQLAGKEHCAVDVKVSDTGIFMDVAPAYGNANLLHLTRDIRFDRASGATTLTGSFAFNETAQSVCERFIVMQAPKLGDGFAVLETDGESLTVRFDPAVLQVSTHPEMNYETQVHVVDFTVRGSEKEGSYTLKILA